VIEAERRTVYVIDDNDAFRESLGWLLDAMDYAVVDFADPEAALIALSRVPPSAECCVLLDVRMPVMSGLDLHDRVQGRGLGLPIIYMTGHADVPLAVAAMKRGALTFLEKPLDEQSLEDALAHAFSEPVQRGHHSAIDPDTATRTRRRLANLPVRERQIVEGIVAGCSNREIADQHSISVKTIEYHRAKLMKRLQAKNVAHLVQLLALEAPA